MPRRDSIVFTDEGKCNGQAHGRLHVKVRQLESSKFPTCHDGRVSEARASCSNRWIWMCGADYGVSTHVHSSTSVFASDYLIHKLMVMID